MNFLERVALLAVAVVLSLHGCCHGAEPLKITGPAKADPYKLVELHAEGDVAGAALVWDVAPEEMADVRELPGGNLLFVGPPGTYKVKLRAIRVKDGTTSAESARYVVTIGDSRPKPPDKGPDGKPASMIPQCIGRLRVGNSGCTATPIWPRRADGRWDVLTASHCTSGVGSKGVLSLKDGRELSMTVTARQTGPDITWFVTDAADADLPYGVLAASDPPPGTPVWQAGYGTDRPTIRKDGNVTGSESNGQMAFRLSVSHGDSGGPIFRSDTNEIVGCVCCTSGIAQKADMYGGSATSAARIRPGSMLLPVPDNDQGDEHHHGCARPMEVLPPLVPHR